MAKVFIAHFHVNWLSPVKVRKTMIAGSEKMLVWNDLDQAEKIKIYDKGIKVKQSEREQKERLLVSYRSGDMYAPKIDQVEALSLMVKEFADCIQENRSALTDGKAGSMGIAAAFSFYPGKNMGACGEGGAVTTNVSDIADKIRMLRDHGQAEKYHHQMEGYNGRCDTLQAAALRVKLKHLPVHVVCAYSNDDNIAIIITAYQPHPDRWIDLMRRRK